jgi:hypothetical protein
VKRRRAAHIPMKRCSRLARVAGFFALMIHQETILK